VSGVNVAEPDAAAPSALLQSALERLRLEGAIFFRSELTEGFAFESTPLALADTLHPGAERLIVFHIVAEGRCWVSAEDGERHWASQGAVIVLPYGDRHTIGGEAPAERVPILTLFEAPPWQVMPVLRHGRVGRSPIRYLTEWRMHLAEDLLATTDVGVAVVARRVVYDSAARA
jgi:Cupin